MNTSKRNLTEAEWRAVFKARCRSKCGEPLTDADRELFTVAHKSDPKRYAAMNAEVFEATKPIGSTR